jgi:hypothetical protein
VILSASIGISVYPEDGTDINTVLSNSDLAMYRAKSSLDHKICWYEREMDDKTRQRNMMAADIRRGIHAGSFRSTIRLSATSKIVASPVMKRCCAGSIRSWGDPAGRVYSHRRRERRHRAVRLLGARAGV